MWNFLHDVNAHKKYLPSSHLPAYLHLSICNRTKGNAIVIMFFIMFSMFLFNIYCDNALHT